MKVVINACFGGFSLSPEAETAYLARKGKTPFFYENVRTADGRHDFKNYRRTEASQAGSFTHTLTEDIGSDVTSEEMNTSEAWFSNRDIPRDDPDLIAVIEELGPAADGTYARLQIVEIPDGVEWQIEEYDGSEHVAAAHRTWS